MIRRGGKAPLNFITVLAPAGVEARAELEGDTARVVLAGGRTLTLTADRVELH